MKKQMGLLYVNIQLKIHNVYVCFKILLPAAYPKFQLI
jgi:hypothetical protein